MQEAGPISGAWLAATRSIDPGTFLIAVTVHSEDEPPFTRYPAYSERGQTSTWGRITRAEMRWGRTIVCSPGGFTDLPLTIVSSVR